MKKEIISYATILHLAEACEKQYLEKEMKLSQSEYQSVFADFVEQFKAAQFLGIDYKPVIRVNHPKGIKVTGFEMTVI